MLLGPYRTNSRVWAFAAGCVFVVLGFVDPLAGAAWKGNHSLWAQLFILLRGEWIGGIVEPLGNLFCWSLMLALPAVVLGWVIQAFMVICYSVVRNESVSGAVASDQWKDMPNEPLPQSVSTPHPPKIRIPAMPCRLPNCHTPRYG
jgi:hypothetical protein